MSAALCGQRLSTVAGAARVRCKPLVHHTSARGSRRLWVKASAADMSKDDVKGPMLQPSVVNTHWARSLAMFAAVGAAASATSYLPVKAAAFVHLMSYGVLLGTNVWHTFFVGLTMFKVMPRQMFGRTQAALFPKYFALTTGANIIMLASLLFTRAPALTASALAEVAFKQPALTLVITLVANLANALYVEPTTTTQMFERYELENKENKTEADAARIKAMQKEFGKWHGISSLLNLVVTCGVLAYGWYLAGSFTL